VTPKVDTASIEAQANADSKVQTCRKDVMLNPSKFPSAWEIGIPYKSIVGPQTKEFVTSVSNRLNQQ
jgi:hypothetical protein